MPMPRATGWPSWPKTGPSSARYPDTGLANRLKLVARLIKGGYDSRVFYTSQGGYDTHSQQLGTHFGLLCELSGALKAFLDDLAEAKLADRVLVLCFSEFGRRVQENASAGTDHGAAGPVFLAGPAVKPGLARRLSQPDRSRRRRLEAARRLPPGLRERFSRAGSVCLPRRPSVENSSRFQFWGRDSLIKPDQDAGSVAAEGCHVAHLAAARPRFCYEGLTARPSSP